MQRGIIGVPSGEADRLTTVEPYHDTKHEMGMELSVAIAPEEQYTLTGNTNYIQGPALSEEIEEERKWVFDEDKGAIDSRSTHTKVQHTSNFVAVPGDSDRQGFAMVTSNEGTFAFGVLGRADHTVMERAEIDLGDFYLDREDDFTIQTGGQSGRLDHADTMMAWGDGIEEDDAIGDAVRDAARANTLPQLAGTYHSEVVAVPVKANIAASGYVEVWDPDMSTAEFLQWVQTDILPYVSTVDDDSKDKSEKAKQDPDQPGLDEYDDAEESGEDNEWTEGTCEQCGHDRTKTKIIDGERTCIICDEERGA